MASAPPVKEVATIKINRKTIKRIKIALKNVDWDFWLKFGTFLATLWGALK